MCFFSKPKKAPKPAALPEPPPPPPPPEQTAKAPEEDKSGSMDANKKRKGRASLRFDLGGSPGISGVNIPS